jgi:enoyl-[acyl-carrier-protein] reductase (NADH)
MEEWKMNLDKSVQEVAIQIMNHPNVEKKSKTMLGITFHFYHLVENEIKYVLETKGLGNDKVLSLDISSGNEVNFQFRSYKDDITKLVMVKNTIGYVWNEEFLRFIDTVKNGITEVAQLISTKRQKK